MSSTSSSPYSFMGMPRGMAYQTYQPVTYPKAYAVREIPFDKWWPQYSKALYIIARTIDAKDPNCPVAFEVFVTSLIKLISNPEYRRLMADYYNMKPYVVDTLQKTVPNVFLAYPWLQNLLVTNPTQFRKICFTNQDGQALFLWVYLLHAFMVGVQRSYQPSVSVHMPTLNDQRTIYQVEKLTKADWGNSLWFILHTTSLYAPEPIEDSFVNYQQMLRALQYLIPCPKCRSHLASNLTSIDFVRCPKTKEELFKCSWKLHNMVNKSDNKPEVNLQEAFAYYTY